MPAPIIKRLGSLSGIKDALGSSKCPFFTKKSRYFLRISLPLIYFKLINLQISMIAIHTYYYPSDTVRKYVYKNEKTYLIIA